MKLKHVRLYGTTDSAGAVTVDATKAVYGRLYAVQWIDGSFVNGVDAVISTQGADAAKTLLTLTNADDDALYYPRDLVHDAAGAALTGTQGGDRCLPLISGTPRMVVASGGAAKVGGCVLFYYE